jgi:uncharacterized delta-60 repeat protein
VAIQPDGKILMSGTTYEGFTSKFALMRFTSDGKIDNDFDNDGKLTTRLEGGDTTYKITLQADGKIVVGGRSDTGSYSTSAPKIGLVRYLPDGRLDTSFDEDGKVITSVGSVSWAGNVLSQPDGKILAQAYTNDGFAILRYLPNGSLDSSFDLDGLVNYKINANPNVSRGFALQANGKIIINVESFPPKGLSDGYVLRYLPNGKLDDSFGTGGLVKQNGNAVQLQDDGKMVITERIPFNGKDHYQLVRLTQNGQIDSSFDNKDILSTNFDQMIFKILGDGKILVAGSLGNTYPEGLVLMRFNSNGTRDLSFSPNVIPNTSTNHLPFGEVAISSDTNTSLVNVGGVLTASNTITDLDGIGIVKYQWKSNNTNINGATGSTYKVQAVDEGKSISVEAQYIDGKGNSESLMSVSTSPAVLNDFKAPSILTTPIPLKDVPLNSSIVLSFNEPIRPMAGKIVIKTSSGQIFATYDIGSSENLLFSNSKITITPANQFFYNTDYIVELPTNSISDQSNNVSGAQSFKFTSIAAKNTLPTGEVTISGIPYIGQTLTATNNLSDVDGIGSIAYQWKMNGEQIVGATGATLLLTNSLVGRKISVVASYTDGLNNKDTVAKELSFNIGGFFDGNESNNIFQGSNGPDFYDGRTGFDTVIFTGLVGQYQLKKSGDIVTVKSITGVEATDSMKNVESLKFANMSVNLEVQAKANSIPKASVDRLVELYVAFFNRTPDAEGMSYWIDQLKNGASLNQISESFYNAGVAYSSLTGFSANMSDNDFINVFYKNVLGRADGADSGGLAYWGNKLATGESTRSSLAQDVLNSAHTFKGDSNYGWVVSLLENKISVGTKISIEWGLSYNSGNENVTQGMKIAAAVTPTDTQAALTIIGVSSQDILLT